MPTALPLIRTLTLAAAFPALLPAQTDDFNDGDDAGWTRLAPLAAAGGTTYSFENGAYKMACLPSPNPSAFGPARMASFRADAVYTEFCVAVDITGWDPAEDTSLGILARIQAAPGPGTTSGYALTWQGNDQDLEINRVTGEVPARITPGGLPIPGDSLGIDPAQTYRMVFFGTGNYLEGRIYHLDNLAVPLIVATATDATFASGINGLIIFGDLNTRVSATFDNFRADSGETPPPLAMQMSPSGDLRLSWPLEEALCWRFEASETLDSWQPAEPAHVEGETAVLELSGWTLRAVPRRFFRFAKGRTAP